MEISHLNCEHCNILLLYSESDEMHFMSSAVCDDLNLLDADSSMFCFVNYFYVS